MVHAYIGKKMTINFDKNERKIIYLIAYTKKVDKNITYNEGRI